MPPTIAAPEGLADLLQDVRLAAPISVAALSERCGRSPGDVSAQLGLLRSDGLAREADASWRLTSEGEACLRRHLDAALTADGAVAEAAYATFVAVNEPLKLCCTRWQLREGPRGLEINDHLDRRWDREVIREVRRIHQALRGSLERLAALRPRFARYVGRLAEALSRLEHGDLEALTRPMSQSYHDVWMELHEDLLLVLGRARSAADGA